jgi:hypothetical protein
MSPIRSEPVKHSTRVAALFAALLLCAAPAAAKAPTTWDGLVLVPSKGFQLVYLQPGADFRGYTKIMLDPAEVAFEKNWAKDYNMSVRGASGRVSERDVERTVSEGIAAATALFAAAWQKGGYPVVTEPGSDVLRVRPAVLNITVSAPDVRVERSYTFTDIAGQAVFALEARDSTTNALIGRIVDPEAAGDNTHGQRNRQTNRSDFRHLVDQWAKLSVDGLNQLKSAPQVAP